MSKKNPKSLFAKCIRTLAVSLIPTFLMVSCATSDDNDDNNDNTRPTVASVLPMDKAVDQGQSTMIIVTFSEAIDNSTVTVASDATCAGSVLLSKDGFVSCVPLNGSEIKAETNNTKFTFDPASDLTSGATYSLKLTTAIKDSAGNALAADQTSFFTVSATTSASATATADLTLSLGTAGLTVAEAKTVVDATNAQIANDNLTNSTDLGLIRDSFITGAMTGIGSLEASKRILAVGAATSTIADLVAKFPNLITARAERTTSAVKSKEEYHQGGITQIAKVAHTAKVPESDGGVVAVLEKGTEKTSESYAKNATPAEVQANAANLADTATKATAELKDESGNALPAAKMAEAMGKVGAKVLKGIDNSGKLTGDALAETAGKVGEGSAKGMKEAQAAAKAKGVEISDAQVSAATLAASETTSTVINNSKNLTQEKKKSAQDKIGAGVKKGAKDGGMDTAALASLESQVDQKVTEAKAAAPVDVTPAPTAPATATATATVTIADVSVAETNDNTTATATITLTLDKVVEGGFTVGVSTKDATAIAGIDYTALSSQTVTFAGTANESENVTIAILGDTVAESTETFTVSMGKASKDNVTTSDTATITITDNDTADVAGPPVITSVGISGSGVVRSSDNLTFYTPAAKATLGFTSSEAGQMTFVTTQCTTSSTSVVSGSNSKVLTPIASGNWACIFNVKDSSGNVGSNTTATAFKYDMGAPTADISENYTSGKLIDIPFTLSNIRDDYSGNYGYYVTDNLSFTPDNTTTFKAFDNKTAGASQTDNHTFHESNRSASGTTDTVKKLRFFFKDVVGNISPAFEKVITVPPDNTTPTINSVTVGDQGTKTENATFTDGGSDNRTVELTLSASDNETGLVDWFARTGDNTTPTGSETTGWNKFINDNLTVTYTLDNGTPGTALSDNLSISQASHTIYVWVRDGGGNIAPDNTTDNTTRIYDSIILDTLPPILHDNFTFATHTSPTITSPSSFTTSAPYDNGSAYTDNGSISLTLNFTDNETIHSTASRTYWYFITDNGSTPNPDLDNITGGWLQLHNTSGNSNSRAQSAYGNNTQTINYVLDGTDNRTVSFWVKDNATNISAKRSFNIVLDNMSPTPISGVNLLDRYLPSAVNSTTIVMDNDTLFTDNGTAVSRIFLTDDSRVTPDNTSFMSAPRFHQGTTGNLTFTFSLDHTNSATILEGDNLTLHAWAMDALGNISKDNITSTIVYDNVAPIDGAGKLILTGSVNTPDNNTFYINQSTALGFDNASGPLATDNTSLTYHVRDNTTAPGTSDVFKALTSWSVTKADNATYYVWARDNASNDNNTYLDNLTLVFDNETPTISSVLVYTAFDNTTDNQTSAVISTNNKMFIQVAAADNIVVSSYFWAVDNATAPTASSTWIKLGDNTSANLTAADNLTGLTFDNSSTDNKTLSVYVWVKDNASNISSAKVDNISYLYYK
jgi:hypothetical protein